MNVDESIIEACVEACRAMRKAYRGLIRRNVEAVCISKRITDQAVIDFVVAEVHKRLEKL